MCVVKLAGGYKEGWCVDAYKKRWDGVWVFDDDGDDDDDDDDDGGDDHGDRVMMVMMILLMVKMVMALMNSCRE